MRRGLGIAFVGALAVVGAALAGAMVMPGEARVERSRLVALPPCNVAALLDGFAQFHQWSPWAAIDPATVYAFEGPHRGAGASMTWRSAHPDVGSGRQTVTAVSGCEAVEVALDFEGQGVNDAGFRLASEIGGTRVTWWLRAELGWNPIARYFGPMLDGMIGPDFERGLGNLATYAAKVPTAEFTGLTVDRVDVPPVEAAIVRAAAADDAAVGDELAVAYGRIQAVIEPVGLTLAGPPRASYADAGGGWTIEAAIPVTGTPTGPLVDPTVAIGETASGMALRTVHGGAYDRLPDTWARLRSWAFYNGFEPTGAPFVEIYVTDPASAPIAQVRTELLLFVVPARNPTR